MQNTNNGNGKREWDKLETGVVWERKTRTGSPMLSFKLTVNGTELEYIAFTNKSKYDKDTGELIAGKEKLPDFRVYPSEKREQTAPVNQSPTNTQPTKQPYTKRPAAPKAAVPVEVEDNDVI